MFDQSGELAPDLEWLLQSGQADEETIAINLAQRCYLRVYRQAIDKLLYPETARRAARETFLQAASQARNYTGQGVETWLDQLTGEIITRYQAIQERLSFLNPKLLESTSTSLVDTELSPSRVEAEVEAIRSILRKNLSHQRVRARSIEMTLVLGAILMVLFFLGRMAGINIPGERTAAAQRGSTATGASGPQAPNPDIQALVIPSFKLERNEFDPSPRIQTLYPSYKPESRTDREDPFNLPEWKNSFPPQQPLSLESTAEDIWRRLLLSRRLWNTLWVDVWVVLYGPEGYNGPPRTERHQLWIEQSQRALHLSGPATSTPNFVEVIDSDSSGPAPMQFLFGVDDYARLGSQYPWFYLSRDTLFNSPYMINLYYITIGQTLPPRNLQFKVVGEQDWIGRQTVVVEMIKNDGELIARYWLDKYYGISLRAQYFDSNSSGVAIFQEDVAQIRFDKEFPDELFKRAAIPVNQPNSLLAAGYLDHAGQPLGELYPPAIQPIWAMVAEDPLSPLPLPEGFNLAHSQLIFQLPDADSPEYSDGMLQLQVFADRFYLGDVWFADPFNAICDRSPDGYRIAFTQWPGSPDFRAYSYFWFDLRDLQVVQGSIPGLHILRLKFAPDNRRLAIAGIDNRNGYGRVFVADTITGKLEQLREVEPTWSLDWSPDGKQLAALKWPGARISTGNALLVRVYDLSTGSAYHVQHFAELLGAASIEVPLEGWTAHFSLPVLGLENCTTPTD